MNNLCVDIGWKSINHVGEELCGDHVDIIEAEEDSFIVVLADGLGSGVKACILSTLTSKIISTMMSEGLPLEDCVSTIAATLPICSERGVASVMVLRLSKLANSPTKIIYHFILTPLQSLHPMGSSRTSPSHCSGSVIRLRRLSLIL